MEQQQMKKRKRSTITRRRIQSNSTWPIALDVTTEILSRLPEKSVARFRCVSKLWASITADTYFINLFETRSPRPSLLLCIRRDDNMFVASIPQHTHTLHQNSTKSYSSSQPIVRYHMKFPASGRFMPPTESVHGLICFQDSAKLVIWNPSKRQFLTLPTPTKSWSSITVLLGYEPIEGKHKVVYIPYRRSEEDVCWVLTLGSPQESWRTVKTNHKHRPHYRTPGRCIKGVVYYLAYVYETHVWVTMSFDVRSEKFDMIQFPLDMRNPMLITYDGRLACIHKENSISYDRRLACIQKENSFKMWVLEDAEKHIWSSKEILAPLGTFDARLQTRLSLKGVTNTGEFIYAPLTFCKSRYVLFCDPVRNSYRKFELKGIVDDECRLNQGIQNVLMDDDALYLHAFPNHIENQMSL